MYIYIYIYIHITYIDKICIGPPPAPLHPHPSTTHHWLMKPIAPNPFSFC